MQAQWIKATGEITLVTPAEGKEFSLAELQKYVGGYIEIVRLEGGAYMVVNEEGLIIGLRVNACASALAHHHIVGDVVVCDKGKYHDLHAGENQRGSGAGRADRAG
jgi:hypothetical protein